ncbi:SMP-30/gluconolactonase/LRE family protein [Novosphingobium pentaromativorans]|uniref:Antibiotic induced protein, Drp35 n=1 Tax=Novosphingobium pentaromativorans US6-1 TaxID=1088721 RepID=G6ED66_9SPHN|nr:SMP-30/gluconolactonase/LRE family protein [Novosphingobium pentaromativorans]AIT79840.1 gluconolaconase [Novosphingobium pentaromativorans US6-1]EHJ60778.1 antibiotic induced protein, Drp35 [Novosphingobium pentaromativorans US6-1]
MEFETVTEGLEFPEGPIAMADGSVILVEIKRQTLSRVLPDGTVEVIAHLGGGPNGAAIGPDGAVYVCNNGGFNWMLVDGIVAPHGTPGDYTSGSIQRVDLATGEFTTLYDSCDGRPLRGPNDIVFDRDGGFYFTDLGKTDGEKHDVGHLYYATADGKTIRRVREGMITPNGVGISPDQKSVIVAESHTSRVYVFEITGPGQVEQLVDRWGMRRNVLGPLPGYQSLDSLAIEADGKVCVATLINGGITVFDPETRGTEHIAFPDPIVTNICFGGEDMRDAWITASGTGKLFKCRWPRPGLKLNYNG